MPHEDQVLFLLIAGGRDFSNYEKLKELCDAYSTEFKWIIVITGCAKGADILGEKWALEKNVHNVIRFKPDWEKHGKKAGILRNIEMVNYIKDKKNARVICFWNGKSTGTAHTIKYSKEQGVPLIVFDYAGRETDYSNWPLK